MFEGEFTFQGLTRWNLGWATPNLAGAFLVTLVCFTWNERRRGFAALMAAVVEVLLLVAIAKTYSRGALVALVGAAAMHAALSSTPRRAALVLGVRVAVMLVIVCVTGFGARLDPGAVAADASALNRLTLWRGALEMIAASPVTGWGAQSSGPIFMNWYQGLDRAEEYVTMVNSYLHVAVEYGLFALFAVLFLLAAIGLGGASFRAPAEMRARGAVACLAGWALANIFSTLWLEPWLWVVPLGAIVLLAASWTPPGWNGLVVLARRSAIIAGLGCLSLYGVACFARRHVTETARPLDGEGVHYVSAGERPARWTVWPDAAVLGPYPGKELRRWARTSATGMDLQVFREGHLPAREHSRAGGIMLVGKHADRLAQEAGSAEAAELLVIHPTTSPPDPAVQCRVPTMVVLSDLDELGNNAAWAAWASVSHAQVRYSSLCGLDVRHSWPGVVRGG